jgi:hypothetical protein
VQAIVDSHQSHFAVLSAPVQGYIEIYYMSSKYSVLSL